MFTRAASAKLLRTAGLAVCVVIALLGVFEIGLRLFWDGFYIKGVQIGAPSPTRGWQNLPDTEVTYGEVEFKMRFRHNSWAFRGPEITREKPHDRSRVLVLGDSMVWGMGVEDDETFTALLEARDPSLQVLNAAVSGYSTAQELIQFREVGHQLEPDLVVVSFSYTDVSDNLRDAVEPAFDLRDGELHRREIAVAKQDDAGKEGAPKRREWLKHSYAYRFISDRISLGRRLLRHRLGRFRVVGLKDPEALDGAWELQIALLDALVRDVNAAGARIAILLLTPQELVDPRFAREDRIPVGYAHFADWLHAYCENAGIAIIDPTRELREAFAGSPNAGYYPIDGHWKLPGHQLVAEVMLREIRAQGLVAAPPSAASAHAPLR